MVLFSHSCKISSRYPEKLHDFPVTVLECYKDDFAEWFYPLQLLSGIICLLSIFLGISLFRDKISACAAVCTRYVIDACDRVSSIILLPIIGSDSCLSC